jgi:hypothetical protein
VLYLHADFNITRAGSSAQDNVKGKAVVIVPLTETQLKLRDAGIQMKLAIDNIGDEEVFRSCVNGFISAMRSIPDVMTVESEPNPVLSSWVSERLSQLKKLPIVRFFGQQRDITIHRAAVRPRSISAPIWNMVVNGEQVPGEGTMSAWFFDDVGKYIPNDNGNVPRLCEQYFVLSKAMVHEWLAVRARL